MLKTEIVVISITAITYVLNGVSNIKLDEINPTGATTFALKLPNLEEHLNKNRRQTEDLTNELFIAIYKLQPSSATRDVRI